VSVTPECLYQGSKTIEGKPPIIPKKTKITEERRIPRGSQLTRKGIAAIPYRKMKLTMTENYSVNYDISLELICLGLQGLEDIV